MQGRIPSYARFLYLHTLRVGDGLRTSPMPTIFCANSRKGGGLRTSHIPNFSIQTRVGDGLRTFHIPNFSIQTHVGDGLRTSHTKKDAALITPLIIPSHYPVLHIFQHLLIMINEK